MGEGNKNANTIYIVPDLLEEIFLRLPLESIRNCKTVSKQWRSILESENFVKRRINLKKSRKILAAYNCKCGDRPRLLPESRFEGDEEIVYLHCDATRPSMSCNGLVCLPEPDWIVVLNPSTGQLLRFPHGPDRVTETGSDYFLGNRVIGFGRDEVTGSYKVVKMLVDPMQKECEVLDVESGERKLVELPPYVRCVGREPVCVNGSIYWRFSGMLQMRWGTHILALDLHKEEFHMVSVPETLVKQETQIANLENRLAIANARRVGTDRILEIYRMSAGEETWSKTYSLSLASLLELPKSISMWHMSFTPVAVSKQGNLVFCNDDKRLFKYYSETGEIRCLSLDMCVISPYLENVAPLRSESGRHHPCFKARTSRCRLFSRHPVVSKFLKWVRSWIIEIVLTTAITTNKLWKEESQVDISNRTGSSRFELFLFYFFTSVLASLFLRAAFRS
ncbi:unnamed protein product [Thlaspi arvense]|uniref:F-box domain-containing protein n=1 Tax=Thlaspi arvense TaxID=13288 RepID=A0AAU9S7Y0_THLAR|nr:unnamed protein product [Thlaspi arvense]